MSAQNKKDDDFQTLDLSAMDAVKGGASSGGMDEMMPMMMMMMMMNKNNGPVQQQVVQTTPQFTVNGAAQQGTMGADGSWNYTSNGDDYY
jgi:hypothetical protein